jgi:hypothetical protein
LKTKDETLLPLCARALRNKARILEIATRRAIGSSLDAIVFSPRSNFVAEKKTLWRKGDFSVGCQIAVDPTIEVTEFDDGAAFVVRTENEAADAGGVRDVAFRSPPRRFRALDLSELANPVHE